MTGLSVGTPSAPAFISPTVNGTEFWVTSSSSVSFAPVSWVKLQSLQLLAINDTINDTMFLSHNQTSYGAAQGTGLLQVSEIDDGTKWIVVANFSIGNALTITRTSSVSILHFYALFNSKYLLFTRTYRYVLVRVPRMFN